MNIQTLDEAFEGRFGYEWSDKLLKALAPLIEFGRNGLALRKGDKVDRELFCQRLQRLYRQTLPIRTLSLGMHAEGVEQAHVFLSALNSTVPLHDHDYRPNMVRNPNRALELGIPDDPFELAVGGNIIVPLRERMAASYGFLADLPNPTRAHAKEDTMLNFVTQPFWHYVGLGCEFASQKNQQGLNELREVLELFPVAIVLGRNIGEGFWVTLVD